MTQTTINAQIEAIKKASEKAQQTAESALKFLRDAGIISPSTVQNPPQQTKPTTNKY